MNMKRNILIPLLSLACLTVFSSCSRDPADFLTDAAEGLMEKWDLSEKISLHGDSVYCAENRVYADYDPALASGLIFEDALNVENAEAEFDFWEPVPVSEPAPEPNIAGERQGGFLMRVYDKMPLYAERNGASPVSVLSSGSSMT